MLTVPNRRCTLMRVVPRLAGKIAGVGVVLQYVDINLGFGRFDGTPFESHFLQAWQAATIPAGQGVEDDFRRELPLGQRPPGWRANVCCKA